MPLLSSFRFSRTVCLLLTSTLFLLPACQREPDADTLYSQLTDGEAHFAVQINGQAFYPDDSRFTGEITVAPDRLRLNITDQFESNVIITLDTQGLFDKKPVQRPITIENQTAGSALIGRIRDKVKRTGEGYLMTAGTLTVESLSDDRVVIRLKGKAGNFVTIQDSSTYRPLEGLLVYRRPTINVPAAQKKALLYP